MSLFQSNIALQIEPTFHPSKVGHLYKVYEQTSDQLLMAQLNSKLHAQCGEDFTVRCWMGAELDTLPSSVLYSLARCYAEVFNESWGEDWTVDSALLEVQKCINCDTGHTPVMTLLFKDEEVVGFSWAFIMETDSLTDDSAPFSSSSLKRHESVAVAKYWLDSVGRKNKLISIRELGVLKDHRQDKTPFLTIPIFEKAKAAECNVAFFRTKITSKAFKWSLGVGFVPLQLFMVDDLLLMKGNVKYAMNLLYGSIDDAKRRKSQHEIIGNIKRYLCE